MTKYFPRMTDIAQYNCSTIRFNVPPRIANYWWGGGWKATGRGSTEERPSEIIKNIVLPQAGFSGTGGAPRAQPRVLKVAPGGQ